MTRTFCIAVLVAVLALPAAAQDRVALGYGRLISNDSIGEARDRWQTGSGQSSRVRGAAWTGTLPDRPGALLEYRLGFQVMAPANLRAPRPDDRPLAGALTFGLHTHFSRAKAEVSLGVDLVVTGSQTGLIDFQTALHDQLGYGPASIALKDRQIANGLHPTFAGEVGQTFAFGHARLRPFAEARLGAETLVRIGADFTFGAFGTGELLVRDTVTGHRYRTIRNPEPGFTLVAGGDIAFVDSSIFLPRSRGIDLTDSRSRLRAGVHWQGEKRSVFYGLTWLGPEFDAQPKGQVIGSLRVNWAF